MLARRTTNATSPWAVFNGRGASGSLTRDNRFRRSVPAKGGPQAADGIGRILAAARPRRRQGVIVFELIATFPIVFIFLLAIVEFGLIFVTIKHVSFASRFGAKIASEASLAGLEMTNVSPSSPLFARIRDYLESSGVNGPCQVILEHDVPGVSNPLQDNDPGGCACSPPARPLPTPVIDPDPPNNVISTASTVRVTVVVRIIDNVPDLLCFFGFSIAEKTIKETTTYRYEECTSLTQPSGG